MNWTLGSFFTIDAELSQKMPAPDAHMLLRWAKVNQWTGPDLMAPINTRHVMRHASYNYNDRYADEFAYTDSSVGGGRILGVFGALAHTMLVYFVFCMTYFRVLRFIGRRAASSRHPGRPDARRRFYI